VAATTPASRGPADSLRRRVGAMVATSSPYRWAPALLPGNLLTIR
jgi:hypothetical protein